MTQKYSTQLAAKLGRKLREDDQKRFADQLDAAVAADRSAFDAMDHTIASSDLDARIDAALSVGLPREVVDNLINSYTPASTAKKTPLFQSKRFWFPAMVATAIAGPAIGVAVSLYGDSQVNTQTVDVTPTVEVAPTTSLSPIEANNQFDMFERAQRNKLYDSLTTTTGKDSFLATVDALPATMQYTDKWEPTKTVTVGPKDYMFDIRSVHFFSSDPALQEVPDMYDVFFMSLMKHPALGGSPLMDYHKALEGKAEELGVENVSSGMKPFYDSVRNPSKSDLEAAHTLVSTFIPSHVVDAFKGNISDDIEAAERMIEADPMLFPTSYVSQENGGTYADVKRDLTSEGKALRPGRSLGGDIIITEGGKYVLPEEFEKESPMAKFLYRRGQHFTDNFAVMVDAYFTTDNADAFVDKVWDNVKTTKYIIETEQ